VRTALTVLLGIALGYGLALGCQKRDAQTEAAPARGGAGNAGAPSQSAAELNAPLAKIDDVTITLGELQERINRQSPYIRARYTSLEQKKEFLDSLIRFEILAKEGYRRGLDKDPEVVRTMKQVMIQQLMRDEFDTKITAETIGDPEMKQYYDANLGDYVKPEEVRASAIVLKNKAQAERVLLDAKGDAGKTNKGFRDLVAKYSADEDTKLRGGDLRYFDAQTKDVPAPVIAAAFALVNTGDVSGVVDAGNGTFYILKQTGRRKATTKSFDEAKPQIRNKLFRDKRAQAQKDFVDKLRAQAKIDIDETNLAKVRIDLSSAVDDGRGREAVPPPAAGTAPVVPGVPAGGTVPAPGARGTPTSTPPAPEVPENPGGAIPGKHPEQPTP
jgi:peptidyl-prolyl cis-trans isomerase C